MNKAITLISIFLFNSWALAGNEVVVGSGEIVSIIVATNPGNSKLFIHIPTKRGISSEFEKNLFKFADAGIDIWSLDLNSSYMLDGSDESYSGVDANDIADVIRSGMKAGYDSVFIYSHSKSSRKAIEASYILESSMDYGVDGHIMHAPNLWDLGVDGKPIYGDYSIVSNLPIYVFFEKFSTKYPFSEDISNILSLGGSKVYVHRLPGITSGFMHRPVKILSRKDIKLKNEFHSFYTMASDILLKTKKSDLVIVGNTEKAHETRSGVGKKVDPVTALDFSLTDMGGDLIKLSDLRGKVLLVNFWASWCAPCIEEIPSMDRLESITNGGVEVLAVNIGEGADKILKFKEDVPFDLHVLLDIDGRVAKDWGIYAYPSSYLINKDFKIVYSFIGAVDWEDPSITRIIDDLNKG